ncbi:hypothetical protein [Nevskia sp.]|uniref:hypothetical protein n=1 Tax=Nevskia sp. TaxID=1929292 RepID=UPI0025F4FE43|nr:hypothetical protein [Nevskia sp.]
MSSSRKKGKAKRAEAHVRLYRHELECPAYRTMSTDARALLVEFRSLFNIDENSVFLSVREMERRLNVGQRRAQAARDELLERGWIIELEPGAFHRKNKLATVFALTNEPLKRIDGAVPLKSYMRWQAPVKITVAKLATHGSHTDYREEVISRLEAGDGSRGDYRQHEMASLSVARTATQIVLPPEGTDGASLLAAASSPDIGKSQQLWLLAAWMLVTGVDRGQIS